MNYIGNYLPENIRSVLKRNISQEDLRNIVQATGVSYSSIQNIMNGTQPLTDHTAKAFEKLRAFSADNARSAIEQADVDLQVLADISDHVAA